jgi:hypothetical protein
MFTTPVVFGTVNDKDEVRLQFMHENPDLSNYSNEPMICVVNNQMSPLVFLLIVIVYLGSFFVGTAMMVVLYFRIKARKKEASYRLELMLFSALTVQLLIGYCLLLFPCLITYILIYFQALHAGKAFTVVYAIMSFQCLCDY